MNMSYRFSYASALQEFYCGTCLFQRHAQRRQEGLHTILLLTQDTQKNVFRADVSAIEQFAFLIGEFNRLLSAGIELWLSTHRLLIVN